MRTTMPRRSSTNDSNSAASTSDFSVANGHSPSDSSYNGVDHPARGNEAEFSDVIPTWLLQEELPQENRLLHLIDLYFQNVHPVRCLGFIHLPTFMRRFDDSAGHSNHDSDLILYMICALGAVFYALENFKLQKNNTLLKPLFKAGSGWAKVAENRLLSNIGDISVQGLMTALLLHDYQLRVGNHAKAFILSGLVPRMAQALQLNIEYDFDVLCERDDKSLDPIKKESRRRIMWACYLQDAYIECGVDQLKLLSASDIQIQLPTHEDGFLSGTPYITEVQQQEKTLKFLSSNDIEKLPNSPLYNMGPRAFFIRLIEIRSRILRFIKHLHQAKSPWLPDSEFMALANELDLFVARMPPNVCESYDNLYIYKEHGQLAAFIGLHVALHQTFCDLYRIGMPSLSFPSNVIQVILDSAPSTFLKKCYDMCFHHAICASRLMARMLKYKDKALVDWTLGMNAHECTRIILVCCSKEFSFNGENLTDLSQYIELIESNTKVLQYLRILFAPGDVYYKSLLRLLEKHGLVISTSAADTAVDDSMNAENSRNQPEVCTIATNSNLHYSPDHVLNPLGIYPQARLSVKERHAPETKLYVPQSGVITDDENTEIGPPIDAQLSASANPYPITPVTESSAAEPISTLLGLSSPYDSDASRELFQLFGNWFPPETMTRNDSDSNGLPPWVML